MCTHLHYIRNRYTHKPVLVPCGHCPECLQRKADNRAFRIRNSISDGEIGVFVTLTYKNDYLPVVLRSDIKIGDVPIYRRFSPFNSERFGRVGTVTLSKLPYLFDASKLRGINHYHDNRYISVPFYKDIQDFLKRLRITIKRKHYVIPFKYYACNELGPSTVRAHSHLVFIIKRESFETFRNIIVTCWPFADKDITYNYIQPARNVASYVASYVNCDSRIPKLFQQTEFKPKHAYSQNFGISSFDFSLLVLREKVQSGSLEYVTTSLHKSTTTTSLIPQYVINRYFPVFKGFSRIPLDTLLDFLQRPRKYYNNASWYYFMREIEYTDDDIHKIEVSLHNHYIRYASILYDENREIKFPSFQDYCIDFIAFWKVYASSKMKLFYRKCVENLCSYPWASNYDNCNRWSVRPFNITNNFHKLVYVADPSVFPLSDLYRFGDYNTLPQRVKLNKEFTSRYYALTKRRKTTNYVMSELGHDV